MGEAWRILKAQYALTAFTGEGAAKSGGRWNSRGVSVVYTSGTKSLAILESLVHLNPPIRFTYVAISVKFDDGCWKLSRPRNFQPTGGANPRRPPPKPSAMPG